MKTKLLLPALLSYSSDKAFSFLRFTFVFCLLSFVFLNLSSQVPEGFNYQAIATYSGSPVTTAITVRITIQELETGGETFWIEDHLGVIPNSQGLFNIVIGTGTKVTGSTAASFADIDWSVSPKYLKTDIDYLGWKPMGVSKLQSVPYSMVAEKIVNPVNKIGIKGTTTNMEEALFEVRNSTGQIVFAVYNEGVRIYVDDGSKGSKGGFAIGGFDVEEKGLVPGPELLVVDPTKIRMYIDQAAAVKSPKGGFAIGGFDAAKGYPIQTYMRITNDSTKFFINDDPATKGPKGGFAIGGFDEAKGVKNFFNVESPLATPSVINPSENRILFHPLKNAFLVGKVLITDIANVGENSFVSGFESKAKGMYSQSLGYKTVALGDYSSAIGKNAEANANNSFAFGDGAKVDAAAVNSFSLGQGAWAKATSSYAIGNAAITDATASNSFAFGQGANTIGTNSFAFGNLAKAEGNNSFALGGYAKGLNSRSFGGTAEGESSISSGSASQANGKYSIAMGESVKADKANAIAIGSPFYHPLVPRPPLPSIPAYYTYTEALGESSIAIGSGVTAAADRAISIGWESQANAFASIALGTGVVSNSTYGIAIGFGNTGRGNPLLASDTDPLFEVGNSLYVGVPHNSFTILKNGNTGINTDLPTQTLDVRGPVRIVNGGSYDVWIQGGEATWGDDRNLAMVAFNDATFDKLILNHQAEYANGTEVHGVFTVYGDEGAGSSSVFPGLTVFKDISGEPAVKIVNLANTNTADGLTIQAGQTTFVTPGAKLIRFLRNDGVEIGYIKQSASTAVQYYTPSDLRIKENLVSTELGLSDLMKIQVKDFNFIDDINKTKATGFIAQDLYNIFPDAVSKPLVDDELWQVDYGRVTPLIVKSVQDQQYMIESVIRENQLLKSELQNLKSELEQIKALLQNQE
ncbi:MAG: tail fiber domain-containing protein [Bacteroidales bacterium]|nr:tail fiber domain-containing protein [Bacteroidales bacterium]